MQLKRKMSNDGLDPY
jgi:hypothetical protein